MDDLITRMKILRRDIHAHPEIAFEETRTADIVARRLTDLGYEIATGIAKTGVVATLKRGPDPDNGPKIGLRADLDALPFDERNQFAHRSTHPGKMHACGHDGHVAMLLGAAEKLALEARFNGTVRLIFQPAEENEGGGRVMVEEGLFDRFPVDRVFGMHNYPGMPAGHFAIRKGAMMASSDTIEIRITGQGGHAAMPHVTKDAIVAGSQIVTALQTIRSREINPVTGIVVSITQFHAGDAWNVIPQDVVLRGSVRTFDPETQDWAEKRIAEIAKGVATSLGCMAEVDFMRGYPVLINEADATDRAIKAAVAVAGLDKVDVDKEPWMAGEDFAFMLQACPGAFMLIGNGPGEGGCLLHSPHYDFNDDILEYGIKFWVQLVEQELPLS